MRAPKSLLGRVAALGATVLVASVALVGLSAPAQAAPLGTLTLSPTSGTVADNPMVSATTSAACPTGFGTNATLKVGRNGVFNNLAKIGSAGNYDTAPFTIAANRSFTTSNGGVAPAAGDYDVIMVCTSETQGDLADVFSTTITVTGASWAVKTAPVAQATTTTLTASPASPQVAGTSVTLTATIAPAAAVGTVEFKRGTTSLGTSPVSGGVATLSLTTLPVGTFGLTATFTPGNASFLASTSAAVSYQITAPAGAQTAEQNITGDVAPGAFTLTVAGNAVALTGGTVGGTATGALNTAHVVDLRGTNAGWNLTGQVGDFTGAGTIGANNLGWTPSATKVSGSGAVVAGPLANPGAGSGLGSARALCTATAGSSAGSFDCGAGIKLAIPDNVPPGSYTATLTLTLV